MAIPSFDELLERAKQVAERREEREATDRTSGLAAKGISDFVNTLLFTQGQDRETYTGAVSPEGAFTSFATPKRTGLSLSERIFGGETLKPGDVPGDKIPVTRAEAISNITLGRKEKSAENLLKLKLDAQVAARKQTILQRNQPLIKEVSDLVYSTFGIEPLNKPVLSYGDASTLLRSKGLSDSEFFRELGLNIQLEKDPLFGISPETREEIKGKLGKGRGRLPEKTGTIRVRKKSDGKTGTLPVSEFDPNIYEKL